MQCAVCHTLSAELLGAFFVSHHLLAASGQKRMATSCVSTASIFPGASLVGEGKLHSVSLCAASSSNHREFDDDDQVTVARCAALWQLRTQLGSLPGSSQNGSHGSH
jgi:hypothetical protein